MYNQQAIFFSETIPTQNLKPGIYILKIESQAHVGTTIRRFVKKQKNELKTG